MEVPDLIHLFTGYGLTKNQAKILFALTKTNCYLSVKQISQISNIARETIYKNLLSLREMGFVQKAISKPEKYCTLPLKRILMFLHKKQTEDIHKLEVLTKQVLLENSQKNEIPQSLSNAQFVLIPKKNQVQKKLAKIFINSKKNIKIIINWKRILIGSKLLNKSIKKALNNGVSLQVLITEKPQKTPPLKHEKNLNDQPNAKIKYIDSQSETVQIIIDDQEMVLITDPKIHPSKTPALWTNNPSLIVLAQSYFDILWNQIKIK